MEKLMEIADQQASPEKFNSFMKQNPIWNFYEISKSGYLMMQENEKMQLIDRYYKHMNDGNSKFIFTSCLTCLRMLTLG